MARVKTSKMRRAIVTPDKHFPYEDKPAIQALIKAIKLVKRREQRWSLPCLD